MRTKKTAYGVEVRKIPAEPLEALLSLFPSTRIGELVKLGFNRILFMISPASPDRQRPVLDRYAALIRKFV
jgi:hypothetical protein